MTSSVKIAEYRYVTTNSSNIMSLFDSISNQINDIRFEVTSKYKADFLLKYNLVADNDSFLVTFWVEIFPKNGAKSAKVSENPGKTPEVKGFHTVFGPWRGNLGVSWNRDYFSAPVNTKNYHLNSFPSCAGLSLIERAYVNKAVAAECIRLIKEGDEISKRTEALGHKEPLVINVLGQSFTIEDE